METIPFILNQLITVLFIIGIYYFFYGWFTALIAQKWFKENVKTTDVKNLIVVYVSGAILIMPFSIIYMYGLSCGKFLLAIPYFILSIWGFISYLRSSSEALKVGKARAFGIMLVAGLVSFPVMLIPGILSYLITQ